MRTNWCSHTGGWGSTAPSTPFCSYELGLLWAARSVEKGVAAASRATTQEAGTSGCSEATYRVLDLRQLRKALRPSHRASGEGARPGSGVLAGAYRVELGAGRQADGDGEGSSPDPPSRLLPLYPSSRPRRSSATRSPFNRRYQRGALLGPVRAARCALWHQAISG
ncbi:hypothetical protein PG996_005288 [Apiospora saccharicola]|uniref:Uncharacterized protein n=1 Tax=Apiospora saccharicola TaxID=335842 RepID=A0ABR1VL39_9PEZI